MAQGAGSSMSTADTAAAASAQRDWCHFVLQRPRGGGGGGGDGGRGMQSVQQDLQRLPSTVPVLLGYHALVNKNTHPSSSAVLPESKESTAKTAAARVTWSLEWEGRKFTVCRSPPAPAGSHACPRGGQGQQQGPAQGEGERQTYSLLHSTSGGGGRGSGSGSRGGRPQSSYPPSWVSSHSTRLYLERASKAASASAASLQVRHHCWQFITVSFVPSAAAQHTYETHTKKKWAYTLEKEGNTTDISASSKVQCEEVSLFFEVDTLSGLPTSSALSSPPYGFVHAMLPTKLRLPCPLHLQGSWLLSVDRQDVQSLVENDWNVELLAQFPRLCVVLLQWIAQVHSGHTTFEGSVTQAPTEGPQLSAAYQILPSLEINSPINNNNNSSHPGSQLHARVLEQHVPMLELYQAAVSLPVVPARVTVPPSPLTGRPLAQSGDAMISMLTFLPAKQVIWLPRPFLQLLPVSFLTEWWGGLAPFASVCTGETAFSALWRVAVARPSEESLQRSLRGFERSLVTFCAEATEGEREREEREEREQREREGAGGTCPVRSGDRKINLCVRVLASLGECLSLAPPVKYAGVGSRQDSSGREKSDEGRSGGGKNTGRSSAVSSSGNTSEGGEISGLFGDWLPALTAWPVFPVDTSTTSPTPGHAQAPISAGDRVATLKDMIFLHPEFHSPALPSHIYDILRPAAVWVHEKTGEKVININKKSSQSGNHQHHRHGNRNNSHSHNNNNKWKSRHDPLSL